MSKFFTLQKIKPVLPIRWLFAIGAAFIFSLCGGIASAQSDSINYSNPSKNYLPTVTLGQFTGGYSSGFVQLNWKTLRENDMGHFEIEKSTDGINFRQIGKVQGAGNDTSSNSYTFMDILAEKGSNFYRLVIVDKDGNYTYSKAITISVESKGISLLVVYPNPFSKRVQVKISSEEAEQITIHILDNTGNVVRSQMNNVDKGENFIQVNKVDDLPGGIYYLEVIAKDRKMRIKLMKQ